MPEIKEINKQTTGEIRSTLNTAVERVADELGIKGAVLRGSYDPAGGLCSFKVQFSTPTATGVAQRFLDDFTNYAKSYDLDPEWLGETYVENGTEYMVVGLDLKKPKNCVMLKRTKDGKQFKANPAYLRSAMLLRG